MCYLTSHNYHSLVKGEHLGILLLLYLHGSLNLALRLLERSLLLSGSSREEQIRCFLTAHCFPCQAVITKTLVAEALLCFLTVHCFPWQVLITKTLVAEELLCFLTDALFPLAGVDHEDIGMLKRCYERLLGDDKHAWLNDTHWVEHPPTEVSSSPLPPPIPAKKKRKLLPPPEELPVHKSGSARTEGIYKVDSKQKQQHKV